MRITSRQFRTPSVVAAAVALSLIGCVGALVPTMRLSETTRREVRQNVQVHMGPQLDEGTVERLGVATAISCKNKFWDSASERDAIDQLLYKASLAGGTGIADVACESEGTNFAKNCWSSYTCRAAIVSFARTGPRDGRAGTAGSSSTGLVVSAEGHPKTVPGAATPEAVWENAKDAYRRGDFWTYIESVSPEGHDECICYISFYIAMAGDAGMLTTREVTEMNEILRRNGMAELRRESPDAASNEKPGLFGRKAIHRIKDKVGLYDEMMIYLGIHHLARSALPAWMEVNLKDLSIDGSKATASLEPFGVITFDKVGESWFLHPLPVCLDDIFRNEKGP